MFDPTIFDNLKVVIEGEVYDLDLTGDFLVTDRSDSIDIANMSRRYKVSFRKRNHSLLIKGADLSLKADLLNLSGELLSNKEIVPGCLVEIVFNLKLGNPEYHCPIIENQLKEVWGNRKIVQMVTYQYKNTDSRFDNKVYVSFDRLINEDHIDDLTEMITYITQTLEVLNRIVNKRVQ